MSNQHQNENQKDGQDKQASQYLGERDPNWQPFRMLIGKDGKRTLILGNFVISAEEFIRIAMETFGPEVLEKAKQGPGRHGPTSVPTIIYEL